MSLGVEENLLQISSSCLQKWETGPVKLLKIQTKHRKKNCKRKIKTETYTRVNFYNKIKIRKVWRSILPLKPLNEINGYSGVFFSLEQTQQVDFSERLHHHHHRKLWFLPYLLDCGVRISYICLIKQVFQHLDLMVLLRKPSLIQSY